MSPSRIRRGAPVRQTVLRTVGEPPDPLSSRWVSWATRRFRDLRRRMLRDALSSVLGMGDLLRAVHVRLRDRRTFQRWVRERARISHMTAYNYMRLSAFLERHPRARERLLQWGVTKAYFLARQEDGVARRVLRERSLPAGEGGRKRAEEMSNVEFYRSVGTIAGPGAPVGTAPLARRARVQMDRLARTLAQLRTLRDGLPADEWGALFGAAVDLCRALGEFTGRGGARVTVDDAGIHIRTRPITL